jgi:hypothetical protein
MDCKNINILPKFKIIGKYIETFVSINLKNGVYSLNGLEIIIKLAII